MSEELVTAGVFPNAVIAEIERNRLLSAGIPAVVDTAVKMGSMYGNFVGGVRVLVRRVDAERAAELLEERDPDDELEESAPVDEANPPESVDDARFKDDGDRVADDEADDQSKNPYRSPESASLATRPTDEDKGESDDDLDDRETSRLTTSVDRLFRLSVLGWCFPFMAPAHLVVIWLAADLKERRFQMTDRDRSRLEWASRLSWAAVLLAAIVASLWVVALGVGVTQAIRWEDAR